MSKLVKIPEVNIYEMPNGGTQYNKSDSEVTIGDLHGNAMKLIFVLVMHGIVTNMKPDIYQKLVDIYSMAAHKLTSKDLSLFCYILDHLTFNQTIGIRLIGDDLADRGSNDYFTLKIFEVLYKNQVPVEILLSNHSATFLAAHEVNLRLDAVLDKTESLKNMQLLVTRGLVSLQEIQSIIHTIYLPMLKALSYSLDTGAYGESLIIYSHAPIDLNSIDLLNKDIVQEPKTPHGHWSKEDIIATIDAINIRLQVLLKSKNVERHDTLNYLVWNRDTNLCRNWWGILFVHGHDLGGFERQENVINLDNQLGKRDTSIGCYTAVHQCNIRNECKIKTVNSQNSMASTSTTIRTHESSNEIKEYLLIVINFFIMFLNEDTKANSFSELASGLKLANNSLDLLRSAPAILATFATETPLLNLEHINGPWEAFPTLPSEVLENFYTGLSTSGLLEEIIPNDDALLEFIRSSLLPDTQYQLYRSAMSKINKTGYTLSDVPDTSPYLTALEIVKILGIDPCGSLFRKFQNIIFELIQNNENLFVIPTQVKYEGSASIQMQDPAMRHSFFKRSTQFLQTKPSLNKAVHTHLSILLRFFIVFFYEKAEDKAFAMLEQELCLEHSLHYCPELFSSANAHRPISSGQAELTEVTCSDKTLTGGTPLLQQLYSGRERVQIAIAILATLATDSPALSFEPLTHPPSRISFPTISPETLMNFYHWLAVSDLLGKFFPDSRALLTMVNNVPYSLKFKLAHCVLSQPSIFSTLTNSPNTTPSQLADILDYDQDNVLFEMLKDTMRKWEYTNAAIKPHQIRMEYYQEWYWDIPPPQI